MGVDDAVSMRLSELEARVDALETLRDTRLADAEAVVRKLITHRDAYRGESPRVQLVLSFRQVEVLADALEEEWGSGP